MSHRQRPPLAYSLKQHTKSQKLQKPTHTKQASRDRVAASGSERGRERESERDWEPFNIFGIDRKWHGLFAKAAENRRFFVRYTFTYLAERTTFTRTKNTDTFTTLHIRILEIFRFHISHTYDFMLMKAAYSYIKNILFGFAKIRNVSVCECVHLYMYLYVCAIHSVYKSAKWSSYHLLM